MPSWSKKSCHWVRGTRRLFTAKAMPDVGSWSSRERSERLLADTSRGCWLNKIFIALFCFFLVKLLKNKAVSAYYGYKKMRTKYGYAHLLTIHNSYGSTNCIRFEGIISAFGVTKRHPFVSLSIFDVATFGAARAELSLLKFCRVATNVALNFQCKDRKKAWENKVVIYLLN